MFRKEKSKKENMNAIEKRLWQAVRVRICIMSVSYAMIAVIAVIIHKTIPGTLHAIIGRSFVGFRNP